MSMSPGASARFLCSVAIAMVWSLSACGSDPAGQTPPSPRSEASAPCEVTLTQADHVQAARLEGSSPTLRFLITAPVAVDIEGDCPSDLEVAGATVSRAGGIRLGEQTDGTRPLVLNSDTTHLALIYQPCAKSAPGCFGPQEYRLLPVHLQS